MSIEIMLLLQAMFFPTLALGLAAGIYLVIRMKRAQDNSQPFSTVTTSKAVEKRVSAKQ